jgi:hypothetical protein
LIYNHITARVPGSERHYLINPYGLWYNEVTASNLVKVNLAGDIVDGSKFPINRAGFVIHSAIHGAREDAHCIIHTHSTAGSAVACKKEGLRYDNFYSAILHGHVAYHDFEGLTTDSSEQPRLVASLGASPILILRNHGLLRRHGHSRRLHHVLTPQYLRKSGGHRREGRRERRSARQPAARRAQPAVCRRQAGRDGIRGPLRRAGIRYDDLVCWALAASAPCPPRSATLPPA